MVIRFCQMFAQVTTKRPFPESKQVDKQMIVHQLYSLIGQVFVEQQGGLKYYCGKKLKPFSPKLPSPKNDWARVFFFRERALSIMCEVKSDSRPIIFLKFKSGWIHRGYSPVLTLSSDWIIPIVKFWGLLRVITTNGSCTHKKSWLTLGYHFASAVPSKGEKTRTTSKKTQFSLASWQLNKKE